MEKANDLCEIFCGTHDFKSFRGSFRGNERGRQQDTVCTIESISISKVFDDRNTLPSCETYCISFTGNRFLYKMVRFLVGTIIDFGTGRKGITIDQISQTLCATIRENTETTSNRITTCAPSTGLVLHKVEYPPDWNFKWVRERV
jgi:tRNA pseudouridine(38-40) synthase